MKYYVTYMGVQNGNIAIGSFVAPIRGDGKIREAEQKVLEEKAKETAGFPVTVMGWSELHE